MADLDEAINALRQGIPVLIHDSEDREAEVDMVFHASTIDPDRVNMLRTRAGGLICYATTWSIAFDLGLTWGDTLISMYGELERLTRKRLGYGDRPAFTIWVNHKDVRTGISDEDRAKTIRALDSIVEDYYDKSPLAARERFLSEFQAPGHVPVLASRRLWERQGHTELSIALARLAGLRPSVAFAEMLDYGVSLRIDKARKLAEEKGWPLVLGRDIIEACRNDQVCWNS
ncbi:MAG: 3,4-dihydroxy-2-butanone-4-phosphate synthase [Desulfurococcales archaeon]|nr:3,4-dihydroxy-2-butanone-4-phosphate synthase [Desulfurococcales archaeon]